MYKFLLKYHKMNIDSYSIINYFYTFQFLVKSTTYIDFQLCDFWLEFVFK